MDLLKARGVEFDAIEYLTHPPDRSSLERILDLIKEPPTALVREDKHFKELGLKSGDYRERLQVVDLLLKHPELMQRPIVIRGDRAVIARPPEKLLQLLD